jgi:hypothetical protein
MQAAIINTPTEMRDFLGFHDFGINYLIKLEPEIEPDVRRLLDQIFDDIQYFDPQDMDAMKYHLEYITEPLTNLKEFGVTILGMVTTGNYKISEKIIPNWKRVYFWIIPRFGYFKLDGEDQKVHRFDPACKQAMRDLLSVATKEIGIASWFPSEYVRQSFIDNPPWCEDCCTSEKISVCKASASVTKPALKITSLTVERAIADAEVLLMTTGPSSAVDRVHTALHGYMKTICNDFKILYSNNASITVLFGLIRRSHPALNTKGENQELIVKILRGLSQVIDALNPARNTASMAHPNECLLSEPEAILVINSTRTILQYLDAKLGEK